MTVFEGQHFSAVYLKILGAFLQRGLDSTSSRVGQVLDLGPAVLDLSAGGNRWCLLRARGLNPFFALYELAWLLAGSNELAGLQFYIRDYAKFSDDGRVLWGAYGFRLRRFFGCDQIERAIDILGKDPGSRRVCMTIWSPEDLGKASLDIPCNVFINLKVRNGALDISVANRSNDSFLGILYNVLQFNCIQAYIATKLGLKQGRQTHFIDSLHLYERDLGEVRRIVDASDERSVMRVISSVAPSDLGEYAGLDHENLARNYDRPTGGNDQFSRTRDSFFLWKAGKRTEALNSLPRTEVGLAAAFWFMRRKDFLGTSFPSWVLDE